MTAPLARLYQKGTATPPTGDTLVEERAIDDPALGNMLAKVSPSQYVVVQDAGDAAKTIDNW